MPAVGSLSRMTFGVRHRTMPMLSHCRSPCESCAPKTWCFSERPMSGMSGRMVSIRACALASSRVREKAASHRFCQTLKIRIDLRHLHLEAESGADPRERLLERDVDALEQDTSALRPCRPAQSFRSALAGAVRSDEAADAPRRDDDADVLDRDYPPKALLRPTVSSAGTAFSERAPPSHPMLERGKRRRRA